MECKPKKNADQINTNQTALNVKITLNVDC